MELKKLIDIKELLPLESSVLYRLEHNQDDYSEELTLVIEDDTEIDNLDLDAIHHTFSLIDANQMVCTVFCKGNLKANNIFNHNDDGSCGLIVMGNMQCRNMVVGGQEIYIEGNLNVSECFWGNYNHGQLSVNGKSNAKVFVFTDGYHADMKKENISAEKILSDGLEDQKEGNYLEDNIVMVFQPELMIPEDEIEDEVNSWADWVNRSLCIEWISQKNSIIKEVFEITKEDIDYPKFFSSHQNIQTNEDWISQIPNFLKLIEIAELEPDNELEFENYGWIFTLTKVNKKYPNCKLLIAVNDDFVVSIVLKKMMKKSLFKTKYSYEISAFVRDIKNDFGLHIFEEKAPEQFYKAFNEVWRMVLYHAERGIYFYKQYLEEVKAKDIYDFCTQPIVTEYYNDWRDGNRNGYFFAGKNYSFCIPSEENGSAQLRITKEIKSKYDSYDCRGFRFDTDTIENPTKVDLFYNFSQLEKIEGRYKDYEGTKVYFFDDKLYEESIQWYRKAKVNIPKVNKLYLNGEWDTGECEL